MAEEQIKLRPTSKELQDYAGHCPSCGGKLAFRKPYSEEEMESVEANCPTPTCTKRWSMIFDIDPSGTFGVMSFRCDNEDRIMG